MATPQFSLKIRVDKKWYFFPVFFICKAMVFIGFNPESCASFVSSKCYKYSVLTGKQA